MDANKATVRVGIYGTGRFANQTHLPNLSRLPHVELVAASDPNTAALADTAAAYSIPLTYQDPHQMLAEAELDALYSIVPAFARTDVEAAAAASGIHLFSEKPQSTRMEVARRIAAAVNEGGVLSTVCFRERYRPLFQEAQRLLADKAITKFEKAASITSGQQLYHTNQEAYENLRYGVKVDPGPGRSTETIFLIDWENPESNDFAVAEEVTIEGRHTKRPDLVLYVNGIAVGVIELKRSTVSVSEGIRQNLLNQTTEFIEHFFTTIQFVMAGNETEGLRYGAIETPENFFMQWRRPAPGSPEDQRPLFRDLGILCEPARMLELIHDFVYTQIIQGAYKQFILRQIHFIWFSLRDRIIQTHDNRRPRMSAKSLLKRPIGVV